MKVKYAAQILSHSVSVGIRTFVSLGSLPAETIYTAEFVEIFDKLFDILNSSKLYSSNSNKFTYTNEQVTFLNKTIEFLQRIKIIRKDGKNITNSLKSIKCLIISINSVLQLWNHLQQSSAPIQYLFTRRLNQDSLENFFGAIRKQSGNAFNPTPIQFYYGFKKLFSIDYIKANSGNCTADEESILIRCQDIKETQNIIFQTSSKVTAFINSDPFLKKACKVDTRKSRSLLLSLFRDADWFFL